jgi:hypothetical protein
MDKKTLLLLSVCALAIGLTGCENFSGGGWAISPSDPAKKLTLGFNFDCNDVIGPDLSTVGAQITGNLTLHDQGFTVLNSKGKPVKLAIQAVPNSEPTFPLSCTNLDEIAEELFDVPTGIYVGTYIPQPATLGPGGTFVIGIQDVGQKGPSKGDILNVQLDGGIFGGYTNFNSVIQGGQISMTLD